MWDVLFYIRLLTELLVSSTATPPSKTGVADMVIMMPTLIISDCEAILDPPCSLSEIFSALHIWQAICSPQPVPNLAYEQRLHDLPLVSLVNHHPVLSNIVYRSVNE